mgnify:CR=1 FL=1
MAFECLVDRQVAITKKSAIEDLFFKSIILISSALAESRILKISLFNEFILIISTSK